MIINLPKKFPLNTLNNFVFGDVEAKNDDLLEHPYGFCTNSSITEFLKGRKSIIVGERGAGKSALFRLISDKILQFKSKKNQEHIIIPIEEELEYKSIRDLIIPTIQTPIKEDSLKYRFIWEIFIMHRILAKLKEGFPDSLSEPVKKAISSFETIFNEGKSKVTLMKLLTSQKVTFGIKIDSSYGNVIPVPNLYTSVEPKNDLISSIDKSNEKKDAIEKLNVDMDIYKKEINLFLQQKKSTCFILIDKLDEFVIKEDYDIQKLIIQGLLECERSYQTYTGIKIKIFLRNDLFKKLDFEKLGYEKVKSRSITLLWTAEDIRRFIAQRILYNFGQQLGLPSFKFSIDEEKLYIIDEKSVSSEEEIEDGYKENPFKKWINNLIKKIRKKDSQLFIRNKDQDLREVRHINLTDEINRQIITSIFPRAVQHKAYGGKQESIDIFDYLETHFCLHEGNTTPRIIIMFIEKCFQYVSEYYNNNYDIKIELDENNEFPLIKKDLIIKAYSDFKKEVWDAFCKISSKWENWFNLLRAKKGNRISFKHADIKKLLKAEDDLELNQFLTFLDHIGYMHLLPILEKGERNYTLPILFR